MPGAAAPAVVPLGFPAWFAEWLGDRSVSAAPVVVIAVAGAPVPSVPGWFGRARAYREPAASVPERAAVGPCTVVALPAAVLGRLSPVRVGWTLLHAVSGVVPGCLVLSGLAARVGLGAAVAGGLRVAAVGPPAQPSGRGGTSRVCCRRCC
ncbi:hypothetical protein [Streptomyces sp. NPDC001135]